MGKLIEFDSGPHIVRGPKHTHGDLYLNAKSKPIIHVHSIGVFQSIKCVEWYQRRGEPVPEGTPTWDECQAEWDRQKEPTQ
jgi:hypothetical protein